MEYNRHTLASPMFQIVFDTEKRTPLIITREEPTELQKIMKSFFRCEIESKQFGKDKYCVRAMTLCRTLEHCEEVLNRFSKTLDNLQWKKYWEHRMGFRHYSFENGSATTLPVCLFRNERTHVYPPFLHTGEGTFLLRMYENEPVIINNIININPINFAGNNNGVINTNLADNGDARIINWINNNPVNGEASKKYLEKINRELGIKLSSKKLATILRICGYQVIHKKNSNIWCKMPTG